MHVAAYRCWDLIIERLELNLVYSMGMESIAGGGESGGRFLCGYVRSNHIRNTTRLVVHVYSE